jgi:hypothetical protein
MYMSEANKSKNKIEVLGHTEGYSIIEGCIKQSLGEPKQEAEEITMEEFLNIIKQDISDNSK